MKKSLFPVIVKKLKKIVEKDIKVEDGVLADYCPKMVFAASAEQARELVLVELLQAEGVYDAEDPMVNIEVCQPFVPMATNRY